MYTLVAFKDGKAVGMGRIVGDGAIICYVQDLIIRPEVQGEGIGGLILETLKKFVIQEGYEGTTMMFDLMCASLFRLGKRVRACLKNLPQIVMHILQKAFFKHILVKLLFIFSVVKYKR